jgi:hypothetical protein
MPEAPKASTNSGRREELASRFGMTPDAVERLLTNTHAEYATGPEASPPPPVTKPVPPQAGGGLMAAILVALFVVLGITMSFKKGCFDQRVRSPHLAQKAPVDTVQAMLNKQAQVASTPPVTPSDVGPNEVPPEALVAPKETPGASNTGITTMDQAEKASGAAVTTSSNFEAQERLAEMKSNGNRKAHIVRHKGRVPSYEVRER